MIDTEEGFRSALERATQHLANPPQPGSQAEREFATLLDDLEAYRPPMPSRPESPQRTPEQIEASSLTARASALLKSIEDRRRRERLSDFPEDGQGIGPTTGI